MSSAPVVIQCEQRFNRASLGFLWSKRGELDPGQMSIIKSLYDNRKKGSISGSHRVEYRLSRTGAGRLGYGRLYGTKGSFETLEREIRGTLCKEFYHDIDVRNAHPVILAQFVKRFYGKSLKEVEMYCDNRDAYLKRISENKDEAKTAVIKVMYNGANEHPFLADFQNEIRALRKSSWPTKSTPICSRMSANREAIHMGHSCPISFKRKSEQ